MKLIWNPPYRLYYRSWYCQILWKLCKSFLCANHSQGFSFLNAAIWGLWYVSYITDCHFSICKHNIFYFFHILFSERRGWVSFPKFNFSESSTQLKLVCPGCNWGLWRSRVFWSPIFVLVLLPQTSEQLLCPFLSAFVCPLNFSNFLFNSFHQVAISFAVFS